MELPSQLELTPAWRQFREELRRTAGETTYDVWLAALEPQAWDGAHLLLGAPSATQAWVADRFGKLLSACATSAFGQAVTVALAPADAGGPAGGGDRSGSSSTTSARPPRAARPPIDAEAATQRFNPRYTFDQFIIGDSNRLAHAAALAVAEAPSHAYNPLFLHAPPGLGKTHLLHAIANYITEFDPHTTVRYTTVEAFTNGFVSALNTRAIDRFKRIYRELDVLLIDDVQFLASKARTEEEFFHTFNALADAGAQLVLTCDRLPAQLVGLESRLRERFESGLVAHLAPPDHPTRVAILRKRAAVDRLLVPDERVFDTIASRVTDNVRSLEGALIRVVAHHSLTGVPLDVELADRVLDQIHPLPAAPGDLTVSSIQETVASHFHITPDDLRSGSREARYAWPRQIAIHLARELTTSSLQQLGEAFGGRNHATILHACKRVSDRISTSPDDAADVAALAARLARAIDRPC